MINKNLFHLLLIVGYLLCFFTPGSAVTLKKQYDIPLRIGASAIFPTGNEEMYVWGDKPGWVRLYHGNVLRDTFRITRGEGPGDLNNIGNILKNNDRLYIWDKQIRRLSVFSLRFQLLDSKRIPELGLLSNLMKILKGQYLFEWTQTGKNKRGNLFTRKIGLVDVNNSKTCLKALSGMFSIIRKGKRRHNLDKGILLGTTDDNSIYYADNREYKIYSINLQNPSQKPYLFISRNYDKIKCSSEYTDLQYRLWDKPPENENWYEIYPKYLPPLYLIGADSASDYFIVVRNSTTLIREKKARLDIFSKAGTFLGTFKTPISNNQWVVFSPEFYFKDSIILKNNRIYLHLEDRVQVYRIVD